MASTPFVSFSISVPQTSVLTIAIVPSRGMVCASIFVVFRRNQEEEEAKAGQFNREEGLHESISLLEVSGHPRYRSEKSQRRGYGL